jgi:hypothetical protein
MAENGGITAEALFDLTFLKSFCIFATPSSYAPRATKRLFNRLFMDKIRV